MYKNLEEIYQTYFHDVYCYALSLCKNESMAQDLVSQTYVKALEYLPNDYVEVRAWLFRVCRNCFIDQQRKKKRWKFVPFDKLPFLSMKEDSSSLYYQKEKEVMLHKQILKLPQKYRDVMVLFYLGQFTILETANILHISESSVKTRLHRGREKLRQEMEEQEDA